ncbi:MAG: hypothetical protein ACYDC5_11495, partial [Candidatus Dormibacteria bacterium]
MVQGGDGARGCRRHPQHGGVGGRHGRRGSLFAREWGPTMSFPDDRPRRLRRTPAIRRLVQEVQLLPHDLILPCFV